MSAVRSKQYYMGNVWGFFKVFFKVADPFEILDFQNWISVCCVIISWWSKTLCFNTVTGHFIRYTLLVLLHIGPAFAFRNEAYA